MLTRRAAWAEAHPFLLGRGRKDAEAKVASEAGKSCFIRVGNKLPTLRVLGGVVCWLGWFRLSRE